MINCFTLWENGLHDGDQKDEDHIDRNDNVNDHMIMI